MKSNILVSVILPVFNAETTIKDCLISIYNQTYDNIEVIIINDGSTDNSRNIIELFLEENNLKWVLINNKNHGVSVSRNIGIKLSTGRYIAFIDSDDIWMEEKIEKQIDFLEANKAKIVGTLTKDSKSINSSPYREYDIRDMLISNRLVTSSVLIDKEILDEIGYFNENMNYSEDYNLWLKVSIKNKIYVLQDKLVDYKIDSSSKGLSSRLWKMEKGEINNFKELFCEKKINLILFLSATIFSFFKFIVRILRRR